MAIAEHEGLWAHRESVALRKNLFETGSLEGAGADAGEGGALHA